MHLPELLVQHLHGEEEVGREPGSMLPLYATSCCPILELARYTGRKTECRCNADLSCQGSTLVAMAFNEEALGRDDLTVGDYAKSPAWDVLKSTFKAGFPDEPTQVGPASNTRSSPLQASAVISILERPVH